MLAVVQAAPPTALPGINPTRGEIRRDARNVPNHPQQACSGLLPLLVFTGECREPPVSPHEGEMSRSDRGGYRRDLQRRTLPGKNIAWR